jgi:hypothetical protein
MTKAIQNKIDIIGNNNRVVFITVVSCLFLCFSAYMFFVGGAFLGGIERQEISRQFEITSNSVHSLETEYLALRNSINDEYVKSQGFVAVAENNTKYISLANDNTSGVLTLNTR